MHVRLLLLVVVSSLLLGSIVIALALGNLAWFVQTDLNLLIFAIALFLPVVLFSFKQWANILAYRIVGLFMLFVGMQYILHSLVVAVEHQTLLGWLHLAAVSGTAVSLGLHYFNQVNPADTRSHLPQLAVLPFVVTVIPTYNESVSILERTLLTLLRLDYPKDHLGIILSDDGHRDEVKLLAERYGIHYNYGAKCNAKAGNLNSALRYIERNFPDAQLILTQDADELIKPQFLKRVVPYFANEMVGFVQTPKEAIVPSGDPFGSRDRVFYDRIQVGRNGDNAAFSCGSGVIWRIAALRSIGGFSTWNIVEDLTTSYHLHAAGWNSAYHNEIMTVGLSPEDIPTLIKQRGTWATDSWRLFLFDNPLTKPGLSFRQRLHYLETGLSYLTSATFTLVMMGIPLISTALNDYLPIDPVIVITWMLVHSTLFLMLAGGNLNYFYRMRQFWDGLATLSLQAFWLALCSRKRKPAYVVTRKSRVDGYYGHLVLPQIVYTFLAAVSVVINLSQMTDTSYLARLTNVSISLYFIVIHAGVIAATFYGMPAPAWLKPRLVWMGRKSRAKLNEDLIVVDSRAILQQ